MSKTFVVASGKGGTGKTMFAVNAGCMLAQMGYKVCLIDMDMGLRNMDLYLGLENNVVYDVMDVLKGVCRIKQALIKVKDYPGLSFMAASPKKNDGTVTPLHMKVLCDKLKTQFDYIIIDSPAGLDDGTEIALGGADQVLIIINPEIASIRDSSSVCDEIKDFDSKTQALRGKKAEIKFVLNRVNLKLMKAGFAPKPEMFPEEVRSNIIGIIEEDENIHISTNLGTPVINMGETNVYKAFKKIVGRMIKGK